MLSGAEERAEAFQERGGMIADMARQDETRQEAGKEPVYARVDSQDLAELDRMGAEAKPVPASRSQMIAAAVREYVERHGKGKRKG
jgi:hypothetical protein